ncbi:hypothetical protein ACH5RR_035434 [Cinchona calisaya]|uniref:BAG domain-containing protein n=1 Tax=Cinchona calisaya TaxID=153742 RepID=A0ABD2Y463_9GENT
MDYPFFRSYGAKPSVSHFYGYGPTAGGNAAARTPKVVRIPVHFVGSGSDRSGSALKIQKVFRGFLVRKCMKKIMAIKKEVDEIETRVSRREEVELIKNRDGKERLKVNEMLMAHLFQLDSVRGVDSGVRDCRRAVIKKAIALQERVDAISEVQIQNFDVVEERNNGGEIERFENETLIEEKYSEDVMNSEESEANIMICEKEEDGGDSEVNVEESNSFVDNGVRDEPEETCVDKLMVENVERDVVGPEVNNEEEICEKTVALSECVEEMTSEIENDGNNKRNMELVEKMMDGNDKMMKMMTELLERSEVQTRMLNALTHRVEQLEKAFVCDRIKKKKKKLKRHSP